MRMENIRDGTQGNYKDVSRRAEDSDKAVKKNYPVVIITLLIVFLANCGAAVQLLVVFHLTFDTVFSWQAVLIFGFAFSFMEIISCWIHKDQLEI